MSFLHHPPVDPDKPVNPDFEDKDLHLGTVKRFMAGTFAFTFVFFILMFVVHKMYARRFIQERGIATERHIPDAGQPLLQADEWVDLVAYKELEHTRLNTLTNLGETAVIPVNAAMALMIRDQAFPVRGTVASLDVPTVRPMAAPEVQAEAPAAPAVPATAPAEAPAAPAKVPATTPAAAPTPAPKPEPALDPAQIATGKKIWEVNCIVCHSGKKGAIGPNIHNAFGTIRQLEGGREVLMDDAYVLKSLNEPMADIAKGYVPAMNSFKEILTDEQERAVVAYLKSMGKPLPAPAPTPGPAAVAEVPSVPEAPPAAEPLPAAEPTPAPAPTAKPRPGRISA